MKIIYCTRFPNVKISISIFSLHRVRLMDFLLILTQNPIQTDKRLKLFNFVLINCLFKQKNIKHLILMSNGCYALLWCILKICIYQILCIQRLNAVMKMVSMKMDEFSQFASRYSLVVIT